MFDLLAEEFKEKIVADINGSGLPLTAAAYILQEVTKQVAVLAHQQAEEQKKQREAEKSAETKEKGVVYYGNPNGIHQQN